MIGITHVVTADVHLVHPISHWEQELDAKLLIRHVDIGDDLTPCHVIRKSTVVSGKTARDLRSTCLVTVMFPHVKK